VHVAVDGCQLTELLPELVALVLADEGTAVDRSYVERNSGSPCHGEYVEFMG
jgi:hypothetical protein